MIPKTKHTGSIELLTILAATAIIVGIFYGSKTASDKNTNLKLRGRAATLDTCSQFGGTCYPAGTTCSGGYNPGGTCPNAGDLCWLGGTCIIPTPTRPPSPSRTPTPNCISEWGLCGSGTSGICCSGSSCNGTQCVPNPPTCGSLDGTCYRNDYVCDSGFNPGGACPTGEFCWKNGTCAAPTPTKKPTRTPTLTPKPTKKKPKPTRTPTKTPKPTKKITKAPTGIKPTSTPTPIGLLTIDFNDPEDPDSFSTYGYGKAITLTGNIYGLMPIITTIKDTISINLPPDTYTINTKEDKNTKCKDYPSYYIWLSGKGKLKWENNNTDTAYIQGVSYPC